MISDVKGVYLRGLGVAWGCEHGAKVAVTSNENRDDA